jgi:hypothetical protein
MAGSAKLIAAALVLAGSGALFAQSDRANLTGTVTDQSGATISGATVTATHVATNASEPLPRARWASSCSLSWSSVNID